MGPFFSARRLLKTINMESEMKVRKSPLIFYPRYLKPMNSFFLVLFIQCTMAVNKMLMGDGQLFVAKLHQTSVGLYC